jgi:hypothetical protein
VYLITFLTFTILLCSTDLEVVPIASSWNEKLERAKTLDLFASQEDGGGGEYVTVRSFFSKTVKVVTFMDGSQANL